MSKRIESITFYKGIAIIMVIFVHYAQMFDVNFFLNQFARFFQMGCQIFLTLSCFSLTLSSKTKIRSYKAFIQRRIKKIIVGYYLMILVYLCIRILQFKIYGTYDSFVEAVNPIGLILNFTFLHGVYPNAIMNNKIVYGGWFVGTIIILYMIYPLLLKINDKFNGKLKNTWPLFIQVFSFVVIIVANLINERFECINNNFIYFSFINQLPSFCVGLIMYNIFSESKKVQYPLIKGVVLLLVSILLFYYNFKFSFIILPFVFSLSFMYIYFYTNCLINKKNTIILDLIKKYGTYSWEIYLIHSVYVYFILSIFIKFMSKINISNDSVCFVLLPVSYFVIYKMGKLLNIVIMKINKIIFRKEKI